MPQEPPAPAFAVGGPIVPGGDVPLVDRLRGDAPRALAAAGIGGLARDDVRARSAQRLEFAMDAAGAASAVAIGAAMHAMLAAG